MEKFHSSELAKVTKPAEQANPNEPVTTPEAAPEIPLARSTFDPKSESYRRTRRAELHKQFEVVETPAGARGYRGKARGPEQVTHLTPENILWWRIHTQVSRLMEQGGAIESFNLSMLTGDLTVQGTFGVRETPAPQPHAQILTAPGKVTWRITNDLADVSVLDLLGNAAELLDCLEPPAKAGI